VGVVHANVGDEVFLRVGDENRRLTFAQRQELTFDRGQDAYGARPTAALIGEAEGAARGLHAGDRGAGRQSAAPCAWAGRRAAPDGRRLPVLRDHPQTWLSEAFVRVLRYRGSERGSGARQQLATDQRFEGRSRACSPTRVA